jgi:hypothetical protein
MTKTYEDCPCCCNWSIAVIDGKIVRHERGLGYVPYRSYHRISKKFGDSVKSLMRDNLCAASGKTMKEAQAIFNSQQTKEKK